jgi:hypothetical protein
VPKRETRHANLLERLEKLEKTHTDRHIVVDEKMTRMRDRLKQFESEKHTIHEDANREVNNLHAKWRQGDLDLRISAAAPLQKFTAEQRLRKILDSMPPTEATNLIQKIHGGYVQRDGAPEDLSIFSGAEPQSQDKGDQTCHGCDW